MMENVIEKFTNKDLEEALIKANDNDPRIFQGRRKVAIVWYGILAIRILVLVLSVLLPSGSKPSAFNLGLDLFGTLMACFFMMAAYKLGVKNANYLPLLGGIITVSNILKLQPFRMFPYIDFSQKLFAIVVLIMGLWQTFGLLYIIFSTKTNIFFSACKNLISEK